MSEADFYESAFWLLLKYLLTDKNRTAEKSVSKMRLNKEHFIGE